LRALEAGYRIKVIETKVETVGVDTPEDLELAKSLMSKETR
jgi:3-deoxy-manno-octulosonate cytidylyltransferase (CMP-KDO synthetase)